MAQHFGNKIKQLRKKQGLLQRQVAAFLEMDTPLFSKIERGERSAKKEVVKKLAEILKADNEELITLWLADQLYEVVKDENLALKAMHVAEKEIKYKSKRKKKQQ